VVLLVCASLIALLLPWPLKLIVDSVLGGQPLPGFLAVVLPDPADQRLALLAVLVAGGLLVKLLQDVLTVLENYVNTRLELGMVLDVRSDLFRHVQSLSMAYHEKHRAGMLMFVNMLADAPARMVMTIPALAQSFLTLVGMFWVIYFFDATLALLSLIVVPFLYYSVGYYARHIQPRIYKVREMEGEALAIVQEALHMLRVTKAFGREADQFRRFYEQALRGIDARVKVTVRQTLFSLAVNTITAAGTALVLGYGAYHVLTGRLTVGTLLMVMAYLAMVYKPLETISTTIGGLQEVIVNLKLAFGLLDTEPQIKDRPGAVEVESAFGHVAFRHVNFSHQGRTETLRDVTFEARPGQTIAVVGPTGAGKTTLVSLLLRFYDFHDGHILLDGRDVRDLTLASLRRQISVVLQEPLLFSGTVAENIRFGRPDATAEEVVAAALAANAHDFIAALPNGYDTQLGERGVMLSGGERQRIAVARAFLKDAPILILDEPTSSIDSRTEAVFLDALDRLMAGRTTFLIAHRLSTIRSADHILVMDGGRVVEQGTHDELMRRGGLYRQLRDLQTQHGRRRPDRLAELVGEGEAQP
jgi:ABC-type multidrug transport system fused ATPase/permease subunit